MTVRKPLMDKEAWARRWITEDLGSEHPVRSLVERLDKELESLRNNSIQAKFENEKIRKALKELCEVKLIKKAQGDTPHYRKRKGPAWAEAFSCFKEYSKDEDGKS